MPERPVCTVTAGRKNYRDNANELLLPSSGLCVCGAACFHVSIARRAAKVSPEHRARRLQRQLEVLGYKVNLEQVEPAEQAA